MTAKHEWILLAVLVIVVVGGYLKLDWTRDPAPDLPAEEEVFLGEPAPLLAARSHSHDLPTEGQWRGHPQLADLNGDGELDLVASIRRWDRQTPADGIHVWLGDGQGHWASSITGLRRDMSYGGADIGDVNKDGRPDIAFSGHDVTPHIFLAEEDDRWLPISSGINPEAICSDVALGDLTRDGNLDLAVIGSYPKKGSLIVYEGDGYGNFLEIDVLLDKHAFGSHLKMIDIDGDGHVELLGATSVGARVWGYDPETGIVDRSAGLGTPEIGGSELAVDAWDLDGDGTKELLVGGMKYENHLPLQLFRWEDSAWKPWGSGLPQDETFFDIQFARLDADGPPSIVGAGKLGINVIDMPSPGQFERRGRIAQTSGVFNICTGDVIGDDGRDEIVFVGIGGVRVLELEENDR